MITVVGGTYPEVCLEPIWENIFGSGFRAVNLILDNYNTQDVTYYTCADLEIKAHLEYYTQLYPRLAIKITNISKSPEFRYNHPLGIPVITPRPDFYSSSNISLSAKGENIIAYGLLEASIVITGDNVVYDPQSPANPKTFSSTGSRAKHLVVIVNLTEARILSGKQKVDDIKDFFFIEEKCHSLIIKMGAHGALVYDSARNPPTRVPVYKTNEIWPIGSGDVFTAFFATSWFENNDVKKSAFLASRAAAIYCNSKDLNISSQLNNFPFPELTVDAIPTKQVYLAGPFFTFGERWIINEVWSVLKGMDIKVFSPFHDVGHGSAKDVVNKDLKGLSESHVIFAILDGLDSGTLFEIGYAVAQGKKIIAFVQNENEESLKMLEGSECIFERDLTAAIYKTYWEIAN